MATFRKGSWPFNFGIGVSPFVPHYIGYAGAKPIKSYIYSDPQGLEDLRETFAEFLKVYRLKACLEEDLRVEASQVLVGAGAKPLIWATIQVLGKRVILGQGSWVSYSAHADQASKEVVWLKTDLKRGKLAWDDLEATLQKDDLLVLASPSNPWGTIYEEDEMERIGALIRSRGAWLLADEIYWPLVEGESRPSMASYCLERSVLVDSLSKWASLAGWRLGLAWFGMHEDVLSQALTLTTHLYSCAPVPAQLAALDLYGIDKWLCEPSEENHPFAVTLETQNQVLNCVRDYVWKRLSEAPYFRSKPMVRPTGAFYFFLPMHDDLGKRLDARGVRLVEGRHFGLEGYARLAITSFDGTAMVKALHKAQADDTPFDLDQALLDHASALVKGLDIILEETSL